MMHGPINIRLYIYIPSNKVVLDQYIHLILVYFEHNGDDEPYDSMCASLVMSLRPGAGNTENFSFTSYFITY